MYDVLKGAACGEPQHRSPVPDPALAEVRAGARVFLRAVRADDPERLRSMEAHGLLPGVLVRVDSRAPFDGPITLSLGDGSQMSQTIGHELATRIHVSAAED